MITMYMTSKPTFLPTKIERVEVSRVTDASVWIDGRRCAKNSGWDNYHKTWDDARNHLLEAAERDLKCVTKKKGRLDAAIQQLRGMEEPTS